MESIIRKISNIISLIAIFCVSAVFYFNYKGFAYVDGKIVLLTQTAQAEDAPKNGIATVLPADIHINASTKYAVGNADAPFTLYEYSSLGCPHCADFHLDTEPLLVRDYVETGLLRIVFVNFPLDKKSMKAALLANCMTYENYHAFVDELFDRQRSWWLDSDDDRLLQYAAEHGLAYDEAQTCMHDDRVAQDIISDRQQALAQLHLTGTPALFISGPDGNEVIYGAPSYKKLKAYFDSRLAQ